MAIWRTADPDAWLDDPDDPEPPYETTADDAQTAVNFVVLEPGWLPEDCAVESVTVRPEQPPGRPEGTSADDIQQNGYTEGNRCSLRTVVAGDGRRLRCKQFLYDWAPPSGGIAGLWGTDDPEPFDCGDAVGWLGVDYKDNRGAVVQRDRTQVELSVTRGAFSDDELRRLLSGLTHADPEGADVVRGVPFHRLNYWVRYGCRPPGPSHGLWEHAPARPYDACRALSPVALAGESPTALPVQPLVPGGESFALDSTVAFDDAEAVECLYRHRSNGSDHLWLTAAAEDSPLAPDVPPEPAGQAAEVRRTLDLRGTTVHYAALTEASGGWEAFWREGGVHYALWAGPSQALDGEQFRSVVAALGSP